MTNVIYILFFSICLITVGCGTDVGNILIPPIDKAIIIISGDANHAGVSIYDSNGNFISQLANMRSLTKTPRGITQFDPYSFLIANDTTDGIERVYYDGTVESFHGSAFYNGNIYGIVKNSQHVFAVESSRIEVFNLDGTRNASMYINTTTGSCVLSQPRGMTIDSNGYIVVADQADRIMRYDVTSTPTCVSTNSSIGANNPYGVLAHSNGNLYITTQGDDTIYVADADGGNATSIWTTDLTILRDPTAIVELENGDILVASSFLDSVERFTPSGERVGNQAFIRDQNTLNITGMYIVELGEN